MKFILLNGGHQTIAWRPNPSGFFFCKPSFVGSTTMPFVYRVTMAVFLLQRQTWDKYNREHMDGNAENTSFPENVC